MQANGTAVLFSKQNLNFVLYAPASITGSSFSALQIEAFGLDGTTVGGAAGGTENGTLSGSATTSTGLTGTTTTLKGTITGNAGDIVNFTAASSGSDWTRASSVATVVGSYTGAFLVNKVTYTPALTIASNGTITGTDTTTAICTYSGNVSTPDTAHNNYNLTLTSTCFPGQTFSGIGAFFPAGLSNPNGVLSKAELKVGLTDGSSTGIYLNLTAN